MLIKNFTYFTFGYAYSLIFNRKNNPIITHIGAGIFEINFVISNVVPIPPPKKNIKKSIPIKIAITRDTGVPPFLLANTINLAVAQRLVRLLCPDCKEKKPFHRSQYPINFKPKLEVVKHYKAIGCESCFYTGYRGRKAVFEVIPINERLMEKIKNQEFDVEQYLKEKRITSLQDSAFNLFKNGETTIEEIYPLLMNS